jgi:hypothetical protein
MRTTKFLVLAFVLLALGAVAARADIGYRASPDNSNQIGFEPCCGLEPGGISGPFGVGNTITLASTGSPLQSIDLFGYAGGGSKPIEVDLYSGSDPNTGTLLKSVQVTPTGNAYTTEVFHFDGLVVPGTLTFIISIVGNTGSFEDSWVNWQQFTGNTGSPSIGTSGNMWYGAPGSYVVDNSYAVATGAQANTMAVQFNVPEPGAVSGLITMLAALGGLTGILKRRLL